MKKISYTEEQIKKMDPLTAYRMGAVDVLLEISEENQKKIDAREIRRKESFEKLQKKMLERGAFRYFG